MFDTIERLELGRIVFVLISVIASETGIRVRKFEGNISTRFFQGHYIFFIYGINLDKNYVSMLLWDHIKF